MYSQNDLGTIEFSTIGDVLLKDSMNYIFSSKLPILDKWKKSSPPGQNSRTKYNLFLVWKA